MSKINYILKLSFPRKYFPIFIFYLHLPPNPINYNQIHIRGDYMKDFNKMLDEYAKLCVEVGINLQKGQPLVINSPVEGADFVRLVAKHAYELGAKEVHVNWNDEALAMASNM